MGKTRRNYSTSSDSSSGETDILDHIVLKLKKKLKNRKNRKRRLKVRRRETESDFSDSSENGGVMRDETDNESSVLDVDVLKILGTSDKGELLDVSVKDEIVSVWSSILANGLGDEVVKELQAKYRMPKNFVFLGAPELNPEVKSSVTTNCIARDNRLKLNQDVVGAVMAANAKILTLLLEKRGEEGDNEHISQLLEWSSDVGRLLAHLQCEQSKTRRILLASKLDKSLEDTLIAPKTVDGLLFGKDLTEQIKIKKSMEKSALELKKKQVFNKPLNSQSPSKKSTQVKPFLGGRKYISKTEVKKTSNRQVHQERQTSTRSGRVGKVPQRYRKQYSPKRK